MTLPLGRNHPVAVAAGLTACGKPDLPQAGWFKNIRASEAMNAVGRGGD